MRMTRFHIPAAAIVFGLAACSQNPVVRSNLKKSGALEICGNVVNPRYVPVPKGTPMDVARFEGAWGNGNQRWTAHDACGALFVTSVTRTGNATVLFVSGEIPFFNQAPVSEEVSGAIDGNKLIVRLNNGTASFVREGNVLHGQYVGFVSGGAYVTTSTISLPRAASQP